MGVKTGGMEVQAADPANGKRALLGKKRLLPTEKVVS
jgi:hypothetical protein